MSQVRKAPKRALLATLLGSLLLAACGGSSHPAGAPVVKPPTNTPKAAVVKAKVVNGHVCDKRDYSLACPLPIASVATITRGVDPVTQGVDFGWSCPVSSAVNFGASYLSYDTSKNWTLSCIGRFHAQGKATVAVWEAGANDATRGYSLGYSQAKRAASQLQALRAPAGQPFDMAIDCDCAGSSLVGYFQGANAAEPGRINAYGGYNQVAYLYARHLVGHLNWQTYAWSGGRWLPASIAPLEQYLNASAVDYDRAIASGYAQWPAAAHIALPGRYSIYPQTRFVLAHGVKASERNTVKTWDRNRCRPRGDRRGVCTSSHYHLSLLRDREWFVARHKPTRGICVSVGTCGVQWVSLSKPRWGFNHLGARFQGLSRRIG